MKKEAIILAGGFGTRLQKVVSDVPKPMAPVNGRPFLDYLFSYLKFFGYTDVVLSTGHLAAKIAAHYGTEHGGLHLHYCEEQTPLGTGGALKFSLSACETSDVLVMNGDSFFDADLHALRNVHQQRQSVFSIAMRTVEDAARYGTIETDGEKIIAFREKNGLADPGIINAGVYIINRNFFLQHCPSPAAFSLEKDFLEKYVNKFNICGFLSNAYFIDIGIPEDYNRAQHEFKSFKY